MTEIVYWMDIFIDFIKISVVYLPNIRIYIDRFSKINSVTIQIWHSSTLSSDDDNVKSGSCRPTGRPLSTIMLTKADVLERFSMH